MLSKSKLDQKTIFTSTTFLQRILLIKLYGICPSRYPFYIAIFQTLQHDNLCCHLTPLSRNDSYHEKYRKLTQLKMSIKNERFRDNSIKSMYQQAINFTKNNPKLTIYYQEFTRQLIISIDELPEPLLILTASFQLTLISIYILHFNPLRN